MKRILMMGILTSAVVCAGAVLAAAQGDRGSAKLSLNGKTISVDYGRPSLNGRTVERLLGQLPDGDSWRLGANKSTTFTTDGDLVFGDVTVPKGEYSLWAQKAGADSWKLVFNSQHGQWGVGHDEKANYDPAKNVAVVPLKVEKEGNAEQVTIKLENEGGGGEISIQWGNMDLSANFKAK